MPPLLCLRRNEAPYFHGVRNKFRRICYLSRTSSPKPLKTKNLTKTTPRGEYGGVGSPVIETIQLLYWLRRSAMWSGSSPAAARLAP